MEDDAVNQFSETVEKALEFIQHIYDMEVANRSMEEASASLPEGLQVDLEKLDIFAQLTYCGNLQKGDIESAVKGIQTSIRAAFVYGYILSKLKYQKHEFTPLLHPLKGSVQ